MLDQCLLTPPRLSRPLTKPSVSQRAYRHIYAVYKQKQTASVRSRVGTVSFGTEPSPRRSRAAVHEQPPVQAVDFYTGYDYPVGSLNGHVSGGHVTFRPRFQYFWWRQRWQVIPLRYNELPEREMQRRMRIKLQNKGRRPWNVGKSLLQGKGSVQWCVLMMCIEEKDKIKEKTTEAMRRRDVRDHYKKSMNVRLVMLQGAVRVIPLDVWVS